MIKQSEAAPVMEEICSLTASEMVEGFRALRFTPVEVLQSVLRQLDRVNPSLNAVIAIDREGAMKAAMESEARWKAGAPLSGLDGVPISVKDNLYLKGLPATWGSRLLTSFIPEEDEPAIAKLRNAGGVLFGKTNVPEFTVQGYTSNLIFGVTENPHAPGSTPGGSTGGGAAAVASGLGPIAIGTDGGGSLRRPAAHCGLFAWKPSVGHVARYGGFPQILSDFEVIGALSRSAEDLERVRKILEVADPFDQRSWVTLANPPRFAAPLRVAYMPRIEENPVDQNIASAVENFATSFSNAGCMLETIAAPFNAERVAEAWADVMKTGLAWYLSGFGDWKSKVNGNALAIAEEGTSIGTDRLQAALAYAGEVRTQAAELFEHYDLLLSPATAALAWPKDDAFPPEIDGKPVGPRGHAVFTAWMNVAGLPAVTIPIAMTEKAGGIGVQLVAGHGRDRHLLQLLMQSDFLKSYSPSPLARPRLQG